MFIQNQEQQGRLASFWANIQLDLRWFFYVLVLVCIYRVVFIAIMHGYIAPDTTKGAIWTANWMGMRLSLKTAGWAAAVPFLFGTVASLLVPRLAGFARKLRYVWGVLTTFFFSVLFMARFPFYQTFRTTFNIQQMEAGGAEKPTAVLTMMIQDYGLIWRMGVAIALTVIGFFILRWLFRAHTISLPRFFQQKPLLFVPAFLLVFAAFTLFVRFGGSFTFGRGINWESAGVTDDDFLNECVLDDGQALYRAKSMKKQMKAGTTTGVNKENVREYAKMAAGHSDENGDDLTPYLARTAQGPRIAKPRHIFVIIEESGAAWLTMDKYADLHVADGIKSLMAAPNGYSSPTVMPNGEYTSVALTGLITGLSQMNVAVNLQPRSLKEVYPTSFATQLKKLGYAVDFWYGGNPAWASMKPLSLEQGFDHFYGYTDMDAPKVNTFGTSDGAIFDALSAHLDSEPPTVHVIKTVSNHPPYSIDLQAEGFDLEHEKELTRQMPDVDDPDELALELGHYWYMDKMVTKFIKETEAKYPDSLFIVTGDHAVRMDPSRHPTRYEHQAVVFLMYGAGVTKDILPKNVVGGYTNVLPTLMELIAPKGFTYYSIVPSLTTQPEGMGTGFNLSTWVTDKAIGDVQGDGSEALPWTDGSYDAATERAKVDQWLPVARTLSWWMAVHGTNLNATDDDN